MKKFNSRFEEIFDSLVINEHLVITIFAIRSFKTGEFFPMFFTTRAVAESWLESHCRVSGDDLSNWSIIERSLYSF